MKFSSLVTNASVACLVGLLSGSLLSSVYFLSLGDVFIEWEVLSVGSSSIVFVLIFDFMSMLFVFTVSLVSCGVMVFSGSYMAAEKFYSRFIVLVISFIVSMFLLVLSPNLISILLGWDGLGVTSYLLVIYYQSSKSYNAGMITALTNRIGDVGILISVSLLVSTGDWSFTNTSSSNTPALGVVVLIIVMASMTKSAQMPFSAWLPAAMAAPTPVSALVHSSTLVTAGVYLLIRHGFLLSKVVYLQYLLLIGSMTMLMAGISAMQELDMKKVVALSTLSQLGLMMMIIGAGMPLLGFFHLLSHAYFKAMLFMCAGMLIHSMKDYQDIRTMGLGALTLPLTMSIFSVANLSLCGMPFMAGFYSKDLILEMVMMSSSNAFMFFVSMLATFLTVAYTCRLSFLTSTCFVKSEGMYSLLDKDIKMVMGMFVLLLPSLMGGNFLCWCMFSFNKSIVLPLFLKLLILLLIFMSVGLNLSSYIKNKAICWPSPAVWATSNMLFMPLTFSVLSSHLGLAISKTMVRTNDLAWNETLIYSYFVSRLKALMFLQEKLLMSLFSKSLLMVFISGIVFMY